MIPTVCHVLHDPDAGTFGDCMRACVASILELDTGDVPHFYHDGCDGETGIVRMREWLNGRQLAPFFIQYAGEHALSEILELQGTQNPGIHYMLFGRTDDGDHVVVAKDDQVVHDPNWCPSPLVGCGSHGLWTIMVIVRQ